MIRTLEGVTALIRFYLFIRIGVSPRSAWARRHDGFRVATGESVRVTRFGRTCRLFDAVQERLWDLYEAAA